MLLRYRDPKFWEKFRADHWVSSTPTVLRQPFTEFPFSEDALHRTVRAFEAGLRDGAERAKCLVSVGDKEVAPRGPLKRLFKHDSGSMAEFEKNIGRVFDKKRFGLMVTDFHTVDSGIWDPIAAFIQDARHTIDFPVPRAFLDLFYGNYLSHFTGVHKDTQEIFAFVVSGKKRMLTWPIEYFQERLGLSPGDRYFHMRLDLDYRKFRKDAMVLEANAGDVFYWPSDRWHVAEPLPGGAFSGMVSLGLVRPEITLPPAKRQAGFKKKLMAGSNLKSQDLTKVTLADDADRQLRWVTGFGFELGGPISEKAGPAGSVIKKESSLILWKVSGDGLLVATNGQSLVLPPSATLLSLLGSLARGKKISVEANAMAESTTVLETSWDKRGVLKTRKRTSRRDPAASLIDWLLRVHAVAPA